jgi:signal peptidase II
VLPDAVPPAAQATTDAPATIETPATTQAPAVVRVRRYWWATISIIVLDQVTKALVDASLGLYDSSTVIPGLVDLVHVRNEGVAFGLLNNTDLPYKTAVTTMLAVAALAGIALYARQLQPREWVARLGLACILGGAVGNLIDRVRQGYVLDFVDVYWNSWHFWAFNVADAAITIGAILVFVDLLLVRSHASDSV